VKSEQAEAAGVGRVRVIGSECGEAWAFDDKLPSDRCDNVRASGMWVPMRERGCTVEGGTRTKAVKALLSIPLQVVVSPLSSVDEDENVQVQSDHT